MKYNDYPIPDEKLIETLQYHYTNPNIKILQTNNCNTQTQSTKLSELFAYISAETTYLKKYSKKYKEIDECLKSQLCTLSDMGASNISANYAKSNSNFLDYLKCEGEILKILLFLLFLDNLEYSREKLNYILQEQLEVYNFVVNL